MHYAIQVLDAADAVRGAIIGWSGAALKEQRQPPEHRTSRLRGLAASVMRASRQRHSLLELAAGASSSTAQPHGTSSPLPCIEDCDMGILPASCHTKRAGQYVSTILVLYSLRLCQTIQIEVVEVHLCQAYTLEQPNSSERQAGMFRFASSEESTSCAERTACVEQPSNVQQETLQFDKGDAFLGQLMLWDVGGSPTKSTTLALLTTDCAHGRYGRRHPVRRGCSWANRPAEAHACLRSGGVAKRGAAVGHEQPDQAGPPGRWSYQGAACAPCQHPPLAAPAGNPFLHQTGNFPS